MDHGLEVLTEDRDHAGQPAVSEHHDEAVNGPGLRAAEVLQVAESTEIDLGVVARLTVELAYRDRRPEPR